MKVYTKEKYDGAENTLMNNWRSIYYHSNLAKSGHLIKRYIPLSYLNPGGLLIYIARTFPVYIIACNAKVHDEFYELISWTRRVNLNNTDLNDINLVKAFLMFCQDSLSGVEQYWANEIHPCLWKVR